MGMPRDNLACELVLLAALPSFLSQPQHVQLYTPVLDQAQVLSGHRVEHLDIRVDRCCDVEVANFPLDGVGSWLKRPQAAEQPSSNISPDLYVLAYDIATSVRDELRHVHVAACDMPCVYVQMSRQGWNLWYGQGE